MLMRWMIYALLVLGAAPAVAQQWGEVVSIRGSIADDIYAAGDTVDIRADAAGDVVAAGGDVSIGEQVAGDVIAAGADVRLAGEVRDDARLAGGDVTVDARIGDHLAAAGGEIRLTPQSRVAGRAWLAGGEINLDGYIGGEVRAVAGQITLGGRFDGDVVVQGEEVTLLPGAVIVGDFTYRSPQPAVIDKGARVEGTVTHDEMAATEHGPDWGFLVFLVITLAVAGVTLYGLFPGFTAGAAETLVRAPWASLGSGLAVLLLTPPAAFLLMMVVVGLWPGLVALAVYLALLPVGLLVGVYFVAVHAAQWFRRPVASVVGVGVALLVTLIVLALVGIIPIIGSILWFVVLLMGLGASVVQIYRFYRRAPAPTGAS